MKKISRSPAPLWGAGAIASFVHVAFAHKGRGLLLLAMANTAFAQMTLTGRVLLPDSSAVAFANVTLLGEKQQTTASGRFSYEISEAMQKRLGVEIGDDLPILVEKAGLVLLQPANGRIRIPRKAMSQELEIIMAKKGSPLLIKSEAVLENLIQQRVSTAILAEKGGNESLRDVLAEEALRLGLDKDQLREAMNRYKESLRKSEDAIKRGLAALDDVNEAKEFKFRQPKLQEAKSNFREAIYKDETASRTGREADKRLPESYYNLGLAYFREAYYDSAAFFFTKADNAEPNDAEKLNMLGRAFDELAKYERAMQAYQRAYSVDTTNYGRNHPNVAIRLNNIALVLHAKGDYVGALERYTEALKIDEAHLGRNHPDVAIDLNNIGEVLRAQGDYSASLKKFNEALQIDESYWGRNHPDVAIDLNNIALVLKENGDYTDAMKKLTEALRIWEATLGRPHPHVATALNNIGEVLRAQGYFAMALEKYDHALAILTPLLGVDHPNVNIIQENRFQVWWRTLSEVERWRLRTQSRLSKLRDNILVGKEKLQLLNGIGVGYIKQVKADSAVIYFQQALPLAQQLNEQETLGALYNNLGAAYKLKQDWPQALLWLEKSVSHNRSVQGDSAAVLAYTYFHLAGKVKRRN